MTDVKHLTCYYVGESNQKLNTEYKRERRKAQL